VDLFNFAYWWESHEAFEALWRGAETAPAAEFFQGLIQVAAAELKRLVENERAAGALYARGLKRLGVVPSPFLGADVRRIVEETEARRTGAREEPPRIDLALPLADA
jgi:predicted metal-dependent hydrolase